jgi:hypothetical protein
VFELVGGVAPDAVREQNRRETFSCPWLWEKAYQP